MAASSDVSEWQVAGRKSGRRKHGARGTGAAGACHTVGSGPMIFEGPADPAVVAHTVERVKEKAKSLKMSDFWTFTLQTVLEQLKDEGLPLSSEDGLCPRLVCLGIGSAESSPSSAFQLALAWLLAEELAIPERSWADPQMRAADVAAGKELGFELQEGDGPGVAGKRVLLFMPHCDRPLYEAVLSSIAGTDVKDMSQLAHVVLLGNSFQVYRERDEMHMVTTGPGAARADGILQHLYSLVVEQPLPTFPPLPEAFNDLSLMTFPPRATAS